MPVITPAFPSMCATNNIGYSTKQIIQRETERAAKLTNDVFTKKAPWKQLFEKHTFFTQGYKYYLSIISASRTKEAQQMWSGLVQSKVRRLVGEIEMSDSGVAIAHPYVKGFDRVHECHSQDEIDAIYHGELKFMVNTPTTETSIKPVEVKNDAAIEGLLAKAKEDVDLKGEEGVIKVFTTTFYIGLELDSEQGNFNFSLLNHMLTSAVTKKLDISNPVALFRQLCCSWAQYDQEFNSICTIHVRRQVVLLDS